MVGSIILVVAKDEDFARVVKAYLPESKVISAYTLSVAKVILNREQVNVVVTNLHLSERDEGLEVLKMAKNKEVMSILITSNPNKEVIRCAYAHGCNHFFDQRRMIKDMIPFVENYLRVDSFQIERFFEKEFITKNNFLKEKIKDVVRFHHRQTPILITGETGTGKTILAKGIHSLRSLNDEAFQGLNCSVFDDALLSATLFGSVKGAYTGAYKDTKGKIEMAHQGTLFLDEIGTMSTRFQEKLLHVLEDKKFSPIGGERIISSNFSIVSATCEDLKEKMGCGKFRHDLYQRISGLHIKVPPLRERPEDIPLLIKHFLKDGRQVYLENSVVDCLSRYSWPGNIREMKYVVESLKQNPKGIIELQDLPVYIACDGQQTSSGRGLLDQTHQQIIQEKGLKSFFRSLEGEIYRTYYDSCGGQINKLAQTLKISKSTLYRMKEASESTSLSLYS